MFYRILLMSLLTFLFGCGKRTASKDRFPDVPHFPATDNPACVVAPVLVDTGFSAQTFLIVPDRKRIFLVVKGGIGKQEDSPYQLLCLDERGAVQAKTELPGKDGLVHPVLWWTEEGQLSLAIDRAIHTFDPLTLLELQRWHRIDFSNFIASERRDQLTYDEQDDLYETSLSAAAGKSQSAVVRVIPVSDLSFLMLEYAAHPAEAWLLRDKEEVDAWIRQSGQKVAAMNPGGRMEAGTVEDQCARLVLTARDTFDYKMAYPNLKNIESHLYTLDFPGGKTTRFKLSNKEKHSLVLQVADNEYLCTADGAVWFLYEGGFYRFENRSGSSRKQVR